MMNRFAIVTPADLKSAARELSRPSTMAMAGGVDVLDLLKLELAAPATVVNLKHLPELQGIELAPSGELRLGALATLHEVGAHPQVRQRFTAIAEASDEAATPQLRNLGTVGGNLLQRPRCWYFRNPLVNCLKKGGLRCFSVSGLNRYNAILGGGPSFIVHPSNLAPALIAFQASAQITGPDGDRTALLEKFFTPPSVDPRRENDLKPGEIITRVIVPAPPPGARSAYLEAREKQSFDWPLAAAAVVLDAPARGAKVRGARVVMGAVAPIPWRSPDAENALAGAAVDPARARAAAQAALKGAVALSENAYKIAIAKVIVRRAILRAANLAES
jgi:xanthine dehydrogenase YagS FAD-binding subunit